MASRLPNEDNEESMRNMLGWDQAMAALQRNILQQNHQHQTSLNQAAAAAIAAGLTPPTSLSSAAAASMAPMWPYNLPGAAGMLPPAAAAAAAASLASLNNPANSYLNHLQNMHNPESLLAFQQNLLLLEQLQQQRQLLAANPHLLMALQASQATSNASLSPQSHNAVAATTATANTSTTANNPNHHHQQQQHHPHLRPTPAQLNLLNTVSLQLPMNDRQALANSLNGNRSENNPATALTNQHQDSLVDQHFRRSLGEDYNQIMSNAADKINVGK